MSKVEGLRSKASLFAFCEIVTTQHMNLFFSVSGGFALLLFKP